MSVVGETNLASSLCVHVRTNTGLGRPVETVYVNVFSANTLSQFSFESV